MCLVLCDWVTITPKFTTYPPTEYIKKLHRDVGTFQKWSRKSLLRFVQFKFELEKWSRKSARSFLPPSRRNRKVVNKITPSVRPHAARLPSLIRLRLSVPASHSGQRGIHPAPPGSVALRYPVLRASHVFFTLPLLVHIARSSKASRWSVPRYLAIRSMVRCSGHPLPCRQ